MQLGDARQGAAPPLRWSGPVRVWANSSETRVKAQRPRWKEKAARTRLWLWWRRGESNPRPETRRGGLYERIRRLPVAAPVPGGEPLGPLSRLSFPRHPRGSGVRVIPLNDALSRAAGPPGKDGPRLGGQGQFGIGVYWFSRFLTRRGAPARSRARRTVPVETVAPPCSVFKVTSPHIPISHLHYTAFSDATARHTAPAQKVKNA